MKSKLLIISLMLSPLYIFPSGNPQVGDFLLVIFSGVVLVELLMKAYPLKASRILVPWFMLVTWVLAVQMGWLFLMPEMSLRHPMFFIFNFLVAAAIIQFVLNSPRGIDTLLIGIKLGLIISGIGVLLNILIPSVLLGSESFGRITGFFNNPNQLSHYSLCMLAILLVIQRFNFSFTPFTLAATCAGVLGVLAPTSLAGMAGLIILVLAVLVANWGTLKRASKFVLFLIMLPVVIWMVDIMADGALADRIETRLTRVDSKLADLESERNYDRILAFPEYWALGAGEGGYDRFYPFDGLEIHSSMGTLFFSYGIVGVVIFGFLIFRALRKAPISAWLALGAPMVYGLTHMGLRTTVFWLLIASIWLVYQGASKTWAHLNGSIRQILSDTHLPQ